MGKGKSCTAATRKAIVELNNAGFSYQRIATQLNCSKTMVFDAIAHFRKYDTTENIPRKKRPRKTSILTDRKIVRLSKMDPRKTAAVIQRQIMDENEPEISKRTVARRLVEAGLHGRLARMKPMVTIPQRQKRIQFAKKHIEWTANRWKYVLWSDETKINRIGPDGRKHVRRPKRQELNPRYTSPVVKHGGGKINVWGCFSWNGVGPIHRIDGILTKEKYVDILENVMLPWAEENLPVIWTFQQDEPKHTAKLTKRFFDRNSVTVLDWPSSSPDLNPIENLWGDVKKAVSTQNITNLDDLYEKVKQAWYAIPVKRCQDLIVSMQRRCGAVLKQRGFPTKY